MAQSSRTVPHTASATERWRLGSFLACVVLAALLGTVGGQDASWDLRNYHFYNPYAFLHRRGDVDVIPAQLQSWYSPFADLGYYALARAGVPSCVTAIVLSVPAALALFALAQIARRLAPGSGRTSFVAIVTIAATGAAGMPVIGTTMSDWHNVALVLLAVWVLTATDAAAGRRALILHLLAGFCGGAAVGLKLTSAPYALGLAVMVLALPGRGRGRLALLGLGGLTGFAVAYGPWAWELYRRFGNPFFPYFNDQFHSALLPAESFRDNRFTAKSLGALLALPVRLLRKTSGFVSEPGMRDARLVLLAPALARLVSGPGGGAQRGLWRAVAAFAAASYALWALGFGIIRYAVVLEAVSAVAIVTALATALPSRWRGAGVLAVAAIVVAFTQRPHWGRVPHGRPAVVANVPPLGSGAMVVIATWDPVGYVVASLPPDVPVIAILNNVLDPRVGGALEATALERVRAHAGPMYLLTPRGAAREVVRGERVFDVLLREHLRPDLARCLPVRSGVDPEGLALCQLDRT